jgi:hypothetical protein
MAASTLPTTPCEGEGWLCTVIAMGLHMPSGFPGFCHALFGNLADDDVSGAAMLHYLDTVETPEHGTPREGAARRRSCAPRTQNAQYAFLVMSRSRRLVIELSTPHVVGDDRSVESPHIPDRLRPTYICDGFQRYKRNGCGQGTIT